MTSPKHINPRRLQESRIDELNNFESTPFFSNIFNFLYGHKKSNRRYSSGDTSTYLEHKQNSMIYYSEIEGTTNKEVKVQISNRDAFSMKLDPDGLLDLPNFLDSISRAESVSSLTSPEAFRQPLFSEELKFESSFDMQVYDESISNNNLSSNNTGFNISPQSIESPLSAASLPYTDLRVSENHSDGSTDSNIDLNSFFPKEGHHCPTCGKKFLRPSTLSTHMNIHSGEKPYICPFSKCEKSFNARSNMLRHLKIHFKLDKGKYLLPNGRISSEKPTAKQLRLLTQINK